MQRANSKPGCWYCTVCGAMAPGLLLCAQCGTRSYCGKACQRKDWKEMGHNRVCKTIVESRQVARGGSSLDPSSSVMQVDMEAAVGTRVRLHSLTSAAGLNGHAGTIVSTMHDIGRHVVQLGEVRDGRKVQVRPANLELVTDAMKMMPDQTTKEQIKKTKETHRKVAKLIKAGHVDKLRRMLRAGAIRVNDVLILEQLNGHAVRPLHLACAVGQLGMATMLLDACADVEMCDGPRPARVIAETPLMLAALSGHAKVVRMLLKRGNADANTRNPGDGSTALFGAAQQGHLDAAKALVQLGCADVNLARTSRGTGDTPLLMATQNGHFPMVEYLITTGRADVNKSDHEGATPLHTAAWRSIDMVKLLVKVGNADVNKAADDGGTPLIEAISFGHADIARFLIKNGAKDATRTIPTIGQAKNVDDYLRKLGDQTLSDYVGRKRCTVCKELCMPKMCKGCCMVGYCSSECQTKDWEEHKKECKIAQRWNRYRMKKIVTNHSRVVLL